MEQAQTATPAEVDAKIERLNDILRAMGSLVVCFSGGIDSALLLRVAHDVLGERALGLTAISPSLPPGEREESAAVARAIGARHEFVDSHEIDDPSYAANNPDRCFHCKTELYSITTAEARRRGFDHVASGVIVDDLGDYRPGLDAARQQGVRFPLVEAGMTKQDVRAAAARLGLTIWNKPASACLSSRIPYGTSVTRERLARVGGLEADLKALGFRQVRVRYHEMTGSPPVLLARIELALDELPRSFDPTTRQAIVDAGKRHGFHHITVDLAGYRMGSHNEVLQGRSLRIVSLAPQNRLSSLADSPLRSLRTRAHPGRMFTVGSGRRRGGMVLGWLAVCGCGAPDDSFEQPEGFSAEQTALVALSPGQLVRRGDTITSLSSLARLSDRQQRGLAAEADSPETDRRLEVTFLGEYTRGLRVAVAEQPRAFVEVVPVGAQPARARLRHDGALVAYEGAFPRVTSAFGATDQRVEEVLSVQQPEDLPALVYRLVDGEVPLRWDARDDGGLQAFTAQGRALYALIPPFVIDAKGQRVQGRWRVEQRLPRELTVRAEMALDGLTYPLTVDPTFEVAQWTIGANASATARGAAAALYNSGKQCAVVFGGLDPAGLRNDLLLNCTSSWSVPTATGAPTARAYAGLAEDRSTAAGDMYMFGGFIGLGGVSGDLYKLTATTTAATWTKLSPTSSTGTLPTPRMMHGFAWTRLSATTTGLLMWGGVDYYGNPLTDMWSYNPATNVWTSIPCGGGSQPSCPPALYSPTIVPGTTTDLGVYQLGGYSYTSSGVVDTISRWDGTGWTTQTPTSAFLPTTEYDIVSTSGETRPSARYVGFGVRTELGSLLYGGGVLADNSTASDLWAWEGIGVSSQNRWQRLGQRQATATGDLFLLGARESPVAIYDEKNRQVIFFGGTSDGTLGGTLTKTHYYVSQGSSIQGNATISMTIKFVAAQGNKPAQYQLTANTTGSPNGHEEAYFLQRDSTGVWSEIPASATDCFSSTSPGKLQANKPCTVELGSQRAFAVRMRDDRHVIGGSGSGQTCAMPTTAGAILPCNPSTSFQGTWACLATTLTTANCTAP